MRRTPPWHPRRHGDPSQVATRYVSVAAKFALAIAFTVAWVAVSVWISSGWVLDLQPTTGSILAWAIVILVAYLPGGIVAFMAASLVLECWFSVSDAEQELRFRSRVKDPMRRWKLSPMDLESLTRWEDYSRAKDEMFVHTDIPESPWFVVESDDKRRARINMIAHLLASIPFEQVARPPLKLPRRPPPTGYVRTARSLQTEVPDHAAMIS